MNINLILHTSSYLSIILGIISIVMTIMQMQNFKKEQCNILPANLKDILNELNKIKNQIYNETMVTCSESDYEKSKECINFLIRYYENKLNVLNTMNVEIPPEPLRQCPSTLYMSNRKSKLKYVSIICLIGIILSYIFLPIYIKDFYNTLNKNSFIIMMTIVNIILLSRTILIVIRKEMHENQIISIILYTIGILIGIFIYNNYFNAKIKGLLYLIYTIILVLLSIII